MKKYLILGLIILCCGCSAKYNISFIDDSITDELMVMYERNGETDADIDGTFTESFNSIGRDKYYSFKNLSTNKEIKASLSYEFSTENYSNANIPGSCFEAFKFLSDDDNYYLFAQGAFKCSYYAYEELDSLDITINTNHVVLENNADEVKNNKYIWHIDPNDDDVNIRFVTKKEIVKNSIKINYKNVLLISGCVISVFAVISLLIFARYKRVNKI